LQKELLVLPVQVVKAAQEIDHNTKVPPEPNPVQTVVVVVAQKVGGGNPDHVAEDIKL
jgi:hypothetical protein